MHNAITALCIQQLTCIMSCIHRAYAQLHTCSNALKNHENTAAKHWANEAD